MRKEVSLRGLENLFFVLVLTVGCGVFYGSMNTRTFLAGGGLTARSYGMIVSGMLTLVCGGKLAANLVGAAKHVQGEKTSFREIGRMAVCAVLMVGYCCGINYVGYFTSTALFLFLMLLVLSSKRSVKAAVIYAGCSVAFNVALYYLFQAMKVMMPNTPLI